MMLFSFFTTAILATVGSLFIQPSSEISHNKIEEWSSEMDMSQEISWHEELIAGSKELYQWVEDDVVEKFRSDSDGLLHLPGGCELTSTQYQRLQEFRKSADYVQSCYCHEGGVYCKLRKSEQHVHIT